MTKLLVKGIITSILILLVLTPVVVFAQSEPISQADIAITYEELLSWTRGNAIKWELGALYALMGLIGALVTVYGFIGSSLPGTAGQANIEAETERLDRMTKRLEELINDTEIEADDVTAVGNFIQNYRSDLQSERWRQFWISMVFYILLGACFSTLLATNLLQALAIGAGWTGLLGALGLKSDYDGRKKTKDETLELTLDQLKNAKEIINKSENIELRKEFSEKKFNDLEREIKIAKML